MDREPRGFLGTAGDPAHDDRVREAFLALFDQPADALIVPGHQGHVDGVSGRRERWCAESKRTHQSLEGLGVVQRLTEGDPGDAADVDVTSHDGLAKLDPVGVGDAHLDGVLSCVRGEHRPLRGRGPRRRAAGPGRSATPNPAPRARAVPRDLASSASCNASAPETLGARSSVIRVAGKPEGAAAREGSVTRSASWSVEPKGRRARRAETPAMVTVAARDDMTLVARQRTRDRRRSHESSEIEARSTPRPPSSRASSTQTAAGRPPRTTERGDRSPRTNLRAARTRREQRGAAPIAFPATELTRPQHSDQSSSDVLSTRLNTSSFSRKMPVPRATAVSGSSATRAGTPR